MRPDECYSEIYIACNVTMRVNLSYKSINILRPQLLTQQNFNHIHQLRMSSQAQQSHTGDVKVVDTENFHQVLEHFDDEGHLKDKDHVKLAITCGICRERDLAILNHDMDQRSRQRHESYCVLNCGHSFGYVCVHNWLLKNKTCPSCRKNPFCEMGHFSMSDLFGDSGAHEQHEEIKEIRKFLQAKPDCATCEGRDVVPAQLPQPPPEPAHRRHQPVPMGPMVPYERQDLFTDNPFENPFRRRF